MSAPAYWTQSDPDQNPWFRRRWIDPPGPKRKRPGAALTAHRPLRQITNCTNSFEYSSIADARKARLLAAAAALFERRTP
jgi:hypothetical protein